MSLKNVAEINSLLEPAKQYEIKFTISNMRGSSGLGGFISSGNGTSCSANELEMRCRSFTYPGAKIHVTETVIGTHVRRRAALQDRSGTWSTVIYEAKDGRVLNAIHNWMNLINNPLTGFVSMSTLYTSLAKIEFMNGGKTIYLRGVYPISISETSIDANSSSPVEITIQWNYDWFSEDKLLGL